MSSAKELIEQAKNYIGDVKEAVALAYRAYDIILEDRNYAKSRLELKERSDYPRIYARAYARSMISEGIASQILKTQIDEAIAVNDEFSRAIYKEALYSVASDKDIFTFSILGGGWGARLSPVISFESVAGSLEDWARGIIGYREVLGINEENQYENRGLKATQWWYSKVYKKGLEVPTFHGRITYAGRPAPFWQILNSGSPASLPSDRGDGSYNPVQSTPTDFIGHAELELRRNFAVAMDAEKTLWKEEVKQLRLAIEGATELLIEVDSLIENLRADEKIDRAIIAALNKHSRSGDVTDYVDKRKLRLAIKKYRAGEEFTTATIELTAKNDAGRRVRPRKETLIRILEGYEEL